MAVAQTEVTVSGVVVTTENGIKSGVVGAQVELTSLRDTLNKKYTLTALEGAYQFKRVAAGKYRLVTSSLGYEADTMEVVVKRNSPLTVPEWEIRMSQHSIDQVEVTTLATRSTIKGDTISYNAAAYGVLPDADADELITKIPGMKVEDGKLTTQGEEVKKILVDGKEFFGNDIEAALSTLPADAIKTVEVFDKLSDEAEMSGIDDGNSYKTINIVTHNKVRTSMTGKLNATYAAEPRLYDRTQHYADINSNLNIFRDKSRTSLRLQLNNVNANAQSRRGVVGINYVNAWGEKDRLKLESSYTYNLGKSNTSRQTDRDYFLSDKDYNSTSGNIYEHYTSDNNTRSRNNRHNLNARLEYRISPRQRLNVRTQLSINDSHSHGSTTNNYFPISGADATTLGNWNTGAIDALTASLNGNYLLRIGEQAGRTLSVNFAATYSTSDATNESYSEKSKKNKVRQQAATDSKNYSFNLGSTYAEPLGEKAQLTFGYNINRRYSDANKLTHLFDFEDSVYLDEINPRYSNQNNTSFLTHRAGPGLRFNTKTTTITAQLNYQHVTMSSDRIYPIAFTISDKRFQNLTYAITTRVRVEKRHLLSLRINSSTSNPGISQLQDVVNISNINNIRTGNPNLKPSYTHQANIGYTRTDIERGTTFTANIRGAMTNNLIVDSIVMNQEGYQVRDFNGEVVATLSAQGRFSKPVNTDNSWNMNAGVGYSFPVRLLGSNLHFSANGSLRQTPSLLNDEMNLSKEYRLSGTIRINSTFSKNLDFRLQYNPTYTHIINSISESRDNEFIRHQASGNIRTILNCGLTMYVNARYNRYVGLTERSRKMNNSEIICNAGIGMKLLRKRAELQLIVNDIFNQNKGFSHTTNVQYTQISTRDVIGRYYGIKFTYNYRNFGTKKR